MPILDNPCNVTTMKYFQRTLFTLALTLTMLHGGWTTLQGDDWPQILGPSRNGQANGEKLFETWPAEGPKELWSRDCGQGFAGVAVKNNRVILYHRVGTQDLVECLTAKAGDVIWKKQTKSIYRGGVSGDLGPRCVPLIHGEKVFIFGSAGDLRCLEFKTGNLVWERNLIKDYQASEGYFGAGSTPLVVGKQLITIVGGRNGGVVSMNLETGETLWKSAPDTASYSAPIQIRFDNRDAVVCVTKMNVIILAAQTGKVLFQDAYGKRGPTVNAAAPLFFDNSVFLTSSYAIGARLIDLADFENRWANNNSISSQYTTPVFADGFLYGTDGREDFRNGSLRCVNAKNGQVQWKVDEFGLAHVIRSGNQLLIWTIEGKLVLAKLNSKQFVQTAQATIFSQNAKSLPAFSNGRLFVKANGDLKKGKLTCLQVGESG